jgi:hypothetical protein
MEELLKEAEQQRLTATANRSISAGRPSLSFADMKHLATILAERDIEMRVGWVTIRLSAN